MDSTVETLDAGDQTGDASGISILAGENTSELLQDSSQAEQDSMVSREGGGGDDDEGASLFEWLFLSVPFFQYFWHNDGIMACNTHAIHFGGGGGVCACAVKLQVNFPASCHFQELYGCL